MHARMRLQPFGGGARTGLSGRAEVHDYRRPMVGSAADIYSYGVVLWEIITGEKPDKMRGLRAPECAPTPGCPPCSHARRRASRSFITRCLEHTVWWCPAGPLCGGGGCLVPRCSG